MKKRGVSIKISFSSEQRILAQYMKSAPDLKYTKVGEQVCPRTVFLVGRKKI